jgi:hypothetical protein
MYVCTFSKPNSPKSFKFSAAAHLNLASKQSIVSDELHAISKISYAYKITHFNECCEIFLNQIKCGMLNILFTYNTLSVKVLYGKRKEEHVKYETFRCINYNEN